MHGCEKGKAGKKGEKKTFLPEIKSERKSSKLSVRSVKQKTSGFLFIKRKLQPSFDMVEQAHRLAACIFSDAKTTQLFAQSGKQKATNASSAQTGKRRRAFFYVMMITLSFVLGLVTGGLL